MTEEMIKSISYTKEEVDSMIAAALALFVDGLLRILGIIPPFMDLDVNVIDDVIDKVEEDMMPFIIDTAQKAKGYIPRI